MFSILHIVQTSKEDCKDFILAALILIVELIKLDLTVDVLKGLLSIHQKMLLLL